MPSIFSHTVSSFIFLRYCAAPLISHDMLILGDPVMGGTGTKVSRAAAGGASSRAVPHPFKVIKNLSPVMTIRGGDALFILLAIFQMSMYRRLYDKAAHELIF